MAARPLFDFGGNGRANWVRLRTLIILRWFAIAGQIVALTVAQRLIGVQLDIGLCFIAVGAAVIANIGAIAIYPENKRLTEREVAMMLLFDIVQLAFLLFLTGGLNNPFALLILAPVTISATALKPRTTVLLGCVAILLVTGLGVFHLDLMTSSGEILEIPQIFIYGSWVSIVIGILFLSAYAQRVTAELHAMSDALSAVQMAFEREQKLTDLGGVVAATAHELGTPLATIKLVSSELAEELSNQEELAEDARLIHAQAERCGQILHSMGRAGKDDLHLRQAPIEAVIVEAAEPHLVRGKEVVLDFKPGEGGDEAQPVIRRQPELIHGMRNLIQNAVDFAEKTVSVECRWNSEQISLRIWDDGRGYSQHVLPRIGDPFLNYRGSSVSENTRPGYEGMGMGLFIAKTLLERTGAEIVFANGSDGVTSDEEERRVGAIVECRWPRSALLSAGQSDRVALGENQQLSG